MQQIKEVFEYPAGGKDVSIQLLHSRQGHRSAAEYAITFRSLAAQSGWNDVALKTVFQEGLNHKLQAKLVCEGEDATLSEFRNIQNTQVYKWVLQISPLLLTMIFLCPLISLSMRFPKAVVVDSGSAVNLIHADLVNELNIPSVPCIPAINITAVNNEPIGITHQTVPVTLQIGLFFIEVISLSMTFPSWPIHC